MFEEMVSGTNIKATFPSRFPHDFPSFEVLIMSSCCALFFCTAPDWGISQVLPAVYLNEPTLNIQTTAVDGNAQ